MTKSVKPIGGKFQYASALKTSTSLFTLALASSLFTVANAQTVILDGDNVTVTSAANGETISAAAGVTSTVDGAPVVVIANDDVTLSNAGTLATTGITQTVDVLEPTTGAIINNAATGVVTADSRVIQINGDGATLNNDGTILGTGDQRNGTVYTNRTATDFTLNNNLTGSIDAGAANSGAGFSAEGVSAADGGTIINVNNAGTIQGRGQAGAGATTAGDGIRFERTRVMGMLDGTTSASFSGNIVNTGTISSESTQGTTAGIRFVNGVSFSGTIDNSGTISGAQNGLYFGNPTPAGGGDFTGAVVNNAGLISSDSRAFNIDGTGLTVNNSGQIIGTASQRNGTLYADGTADNFTVNNLVGGVIDAGMGNEGSAFGVEVGSAADGANTFTLVNAGTISGRGNAAANTTAAGDGVRIGNPGNSGLAEATITNSGTISSEGDNGTVAGVRFVNGVSFAGTLENSGTISGVRNGLYFGNATPDGGGDFTNAIVNNLEGGVISSGSRAFNVDGNGLTVNNAGSILGTGDQRNGTFYADDTANNYTLNNSGTIDAGIGNQGAGASLSLGAAPVTATIINSGTIQGRTVEGDPLAPTSTLAGDGLRFEGIRGGATTFAPAEFAGTVTNSGLIASGDNVSGSTAGVHFVNGVSFTGTLTNEATGVISGAANGLYFGNPVAGEGADHTGGIVNNLGTISSGSRAFNLDGIGLVVNNSGSILGTGDQRNGTFYADLPAQDFTLNNLATGIIDAGMSNNGAGFSAQLDSVANGGNTFTINNDGLIQGRGQAAAGLTTAGDGVRFERTRVMGALDGSTTGLFDGELNNTGTIASESDQGTAAGVRFVNGVSFQGTINNSGTISGVRNGLYFGNPVPAGGSDHTGGVVNNLVGGVISSGSRAFNVDGTGLVVNNAGSILGTGDQRNGTFYADATADNYTLNNLATGVIDAGIGNNGSGISLQLGAVDGDTRTITINNAGTVNGRGDALPSGQTAGLRLFSTVAGVTVNGDISNTGSITSETAPAILIENVNYTGTITNSGVLTGTAAFDASAALGATSFINNGGSLNGNFVGSAFANTLTFQSTSTLAGSVLGGVATTFDAGSVTTISGAQAIEGNVASNGTLNLGLGADSLAVSGNTVFGPSSVVNVSTNVDVTQTLLGTPVSVISQTGTFTDNGLLVNVQDDDLLVDFVVAAVDGVTVTATAADLAAISADTNIAAFGGALTTAFVAGQLDVDVANALNVTGDPVAFEDAALSLLPSINEGVTREVFETHGLVDQFVERRLASDAQRGIWVQGFGRTADAATESRSSTGYDANAFGLAFGADTKISEELTVGASFNYADIDVDSTGIADQQVELDSFEVTAYAGYRKGATFVNGQVGYIFGDGESTRDGATGPITGNFDVDGFTAQTSAGYDIPYGAWTVTPEAGLRFASISQDDFTEVGGLGLAVDASSVQYLDARIGANVEGNFGGLKPFARASYIYDIIGDETEFDVNFAGAAGPFSLASDDPAQSRFKIGTGLSYDNGKGFTIGVEYDGEFSDDYQSHGGFIRGRVAF